jgi:hypothetical protein
MQTFAPAFTPPKVELQRNRTDQSAETLKYLANRFDEVKKGWLDWRSLERPLEEQYIHGHLSVICHLGVSFSHESELLRRPSGNDRPNSGERYFRAILGFHADVPNANHFQVGNKVFMFVSDVQVMKVPHVGIRSLVGLYDVNYELLNGLVSLGNFPAIESRDDVLFRSERKFSVLRGCGKQRNESVPQEIKSGVKIVNSIPDGKSEFDWKRLLGCVESQHIASKMRCEFDQNGMGIFVDVSSQFQIELLDVLLSPSNL